MSKQSLLATALLVIASLSFTACSDAPKGDSAAVTEEQTAAAATGQSMMVDTTTSLVKFTGYGVGKTTLAISSYHRAW